METENTTTTESTQQFTPSDGTKAPEGEAGQSGQGEVKLASLFDDGPNEPDKTGGETAGARDAEAGEKAAPLTKEDIAVPEGFTYDEELGKSFLDAVNDGSLSRKDLVNKLVGMYAEQQGKMLAALQAADEEQAKQFEAEMAKERDEWTKQCQADAEFGGQKWEASQAVIDRGCAQVATPEAVGLLQRYNLNRHPEIVRMFYRAGRLAGEDRGIAGGNGGRPANPAEALFGESLRSWRDRGAAGQTRTPPNAPLNLRGTAISGAEALFGDSLKGLKNLNTGGNIING